MNIWCFTGNLGEDAEIRFTKAGSPVLNFSVAASAGWGDNKKTIWARCALYGKRGEALVNMMRKGSTVGVSGELSTHEYDGNQGKVTSIDVRVNEVTLLGSGTKKRKPEEAAPAQDDFKDDEIPFN